MGAAVDIPVSIAAFAMTAIFICLLVTQKFTSANIVAMVVAMAGVYLCKALGLTGPAILIGAVAGVVCAMAFAVAAGKGGSHPAGFPPEGVEGAAGASPSEGAANAGVPAGASEGGEGR